MRLDMIKNALLSVSENVFHFHAPPNQNPDYIVWAEDGIRNFQANNKQNETTITGTIDLFTKNQNSSLVNSISEELNKIPAAWYLNSIQREPETGLLHYEWVFEV